jgi:hypothetical protein
MQVCEGVTLMTKTRTLLISFRYVQQRRERIIKVNEDTEQQIMRKI